MTTRFSVGLAVPVLNAEAHLPAFFAGLRAQTRQPDRILFIDSSSADATRALLQRADYPCRVIRREDFDHGGTRQQAVVWLGDVDILIFMTQDAIPAHPEAIAKLVRSFENPRVGLAYGRQLPRPGAKAIESHARLFNYGGESRIKSRADIGRLGIKTVFVSNSFAAYRRQALQAVGGFPSGLIFGEDTYVAAKMVLADWQIAYCADACVYHSHHYNLRQEFRRHFDIGVFHARESWLRMAFGHAVGEGLRYVGSEWRYLLRENPALLPAACLRAGLKLAGYKLGKMERLMPVGMKARLSMNGGFWRRHRG